MQYNEEINKIYNNIKLTNNDVDFMQSTCILVIYSTIVQCSIAYFEDISFLYEIETMKPYGGICVDNLHRYYTKGGRI